MVVYRDVFSCNARARRTAHGTARRTLTRTNTNPNDTEANAAGKRGNWRALRNQSKCGMIQERRGIGQIPRKICKKRGICGIVAITTLALGCSASSRSVGPYTGPHSMTVDSYEHADSSTTRRLTRAVYGVGCSGSGLFISFVANC